MWAWIVSWFAKPALEDILGKVEEEAYLAGSIKLLEWELEKSQEDKDQHAVDVLTGIIASLKALDV